MFGGLSDAETAMQWRSSDPLNSDAFSAGIGVRCKIFSVMLLIRGFVAAIQKVKGALEATGATEGGISLQASLDI